MIQYSQTIGTKMKINFKKIIKQIQEHNFECSFIISGGGTQAISEFLKYGGSSNILQKAYVPYNQIAILELLNEYKVESEELQHPQIQYNSQELADCYAEIALKQTVDGNGWVRRLEYSSLDEQEFNYGNVLTKKIGIGVTASLIKSENEREGRINSFYVSVKNAEKTLTKRFVFNKKTISNREDQEEYCAKEVLLTLLDFLNPEIKNCNLTNEYGTSHCEVSDGLLDFEEIHIVPYHMISSVGRHESNIIFPGSYNFIHLGHISIFNKVSEIYDIQRGLHDKISFEISTKNADKGSINFKDLKNRLDEIQKQIPDAKTYITNKSLFIEKARQFPNCKFIVGYDTFSRIGNVKYYKNEQDMLDCFAEFKKLGTKFILAHRNSNNEDIKKLPDTLRELIEIVIDTNICLSSTEIRNMK
jgi:nicotinic acid mononucleotide adenylyltransferase/methanogenic corrinoid protein MtbC1